MSINMKTAAAAIAATLIAGSAVAENYFGISRTMDAGGTLTIPVVTSEMDGFVAVYDYRTGEFGDLLGSEPINAGANANVLVNLEMRADDDVAVVLFHTMMGAPAEAVEWVEVDIED